MFHNYIIIGLFWGKWAERKEREQQWGMKSIKVHSMYEDGIKKSTKNC
jgi:hypothetical protein